MPYARTLSHQPNTKLSRMPTTFSTVRSLAAPYPLSLLPFSVTPKPEATLRQNALPGRIDTATAHELAMNPDTFPGRSDEEILSTLAHEMAHVWQQTHGTPSRRSYHDRQWAAKMKEIGLQPTTTGEPGGKETGQTVTHYIIPGGAFAQAFAKLKATGFRLNWQSRPEDKQAKAKKAASKTKYTCPGCGQNAWAKPDASLICGECYDDGEGDICQLEAETGDDEA